MHNGWMGQRMKWQQLYYFPAITFCWVELNAQEGVQSASKNITQQWSPSRDSFLCVGIITSLPFCLQRQTGGKKAVSTVNFHFHISCHRHSFVVSSVYSYSGKTESVSSWHSKRCVVLMRDRTGSWEKQQEYMECQALDSCLSHVVTSSGTRKIAQRKDDKSYYIKLCFLWGDNILYMHLNDLFMYSKKA